VLLVYVIYRTLENAALVSAVATTESGNRYHGVEKLVTAQSGSAPRPYQGLPVKTAAGQRSAAIGKIPSSQRISIANQGH